MGTRQLSDEELAGFSDEHLQYEVGMLHGTAQALRDPPRDQDGTIGAIIEYALLESFLIHARVLINFLYDGPKRDDDVAAEDFFDEEEQWTEHRPAKSCLLRENRERINKALAHLTKVRVGLKPEMKQWEYWEIKNEIVGILAHFCTLVPKCRLGAEFRRFVSKCWDSQIDGRRASETLKFATAGPTSAAFATELEMWFSDPAPKANDHRAAATAAFACLLDAQPEPARAAFAYCLAVAMVQAGKARLVETRAGDASAVCVFETVAGDTFSMAKPRITKEQEAALIDAIRHILEEAGGL